MDVLRHNREAWDREVAGGNRWTVPVGPRRHRAGPHGRLVDRAHPDPARPAEWLGRRAGKRVLALASGGGQQGPVLAAAGARVTVLDASPAQLAQDRAVAEREGLDLETVLGRHGRPPRLR